MTKILVVEDEPGIALGLEDDLRLEGWDVEVVGDGLSASRRAREQSFDLILPDVMLPGKDGFDVCREVRKAGVRTPIIMMTAKAQEAEKVLGLDLGADDYVTKPFSPRELRARIRAALRRGSTPAPQPPDVYRFGDIGCGAAAPSWRRRPPSSRCWRRSFAIADASSAVKSCSIRRGVKAHSSPIASSTTTSSRCGGRSSRTRRSRSIWSACAGSGTGSTGRVLTER
jgi:CheY-like chemotaxis protein